MRHWIDHTERHWDNQCRESLLVSIVWIDYRVSVVTCSFLDTRSFHTLCCTCVSLYTDHSDVALSITSRRLVYDRSADWEVPTPRVAIHDQWNDEQQ